MTLPVNARMLRFPDSPEEVLGFGFFQRLPAEPPSAIGQFTDRGIAEVEGRASIEFHLEIGEASERFWLDLERGGLIVKYERWWKKHLAERIDRVELAQEKSKSGEASWRPVRWHKALFVGLCVPGSSSDLPGGTIVQDHSNVKPPRAWKAFREPITKTHVQIINSTVKYNRERGAKEGFAVNAVRGNVVRDLTKNSSPRVEGRRTADATDYPSLQAGLDLLEKDAKGERTFLAANYRDNTSWWWYGSIVLAAVAVGLLIHIRRRQ